MSNRHILDGVGGLITAGQKDWARSNLRADTLSLLKLRLENEKSPLLVFAKTAKNNQKMPFFAPIHAKQSIQNGLRTPLTPHMQVMLIHSTHRWG